MITEPLLNRPFDLEKQHCYTLVRDFYALNFGMELPDYANPTLWWRKGLDLYRQLADELNFELVHDHCHDWKPGYVVLMAIDSPVGNHLGVIVEGGKMLHHPLNMLSQRTSYASLWRNSTVAVYRHRLVDYSSAPALTLEDILPAHVKRRVENLIARETP